MKIWTNSIPRNWSHVYGLSALIVDGRPAEYGSGPAEAGRHSADPLLSDSRVALGEKQPGSGSTRPLFDHPPGRPVAGIVRLPVADARWEKPAAPESGCRRNFGHIVPRAEGGIASRAILVGIEVMTTELEMVVDPTVGGEETRRMTR